MEIMQIREYKEKDEKAVIDLWFKCDLVVPWNNPKQDIERKLKVNPELFLVGLVDEKVVASVMGGYEGHRGWINYLAVDPDCQNSGYGKVLMDEIETRITAIGCPKVQLQVRTSNKKVIDFYKSIGYRDDNVVGLGKRIIEDEPFDHPEDQAT